MILMTEETTLDASLTANSNVINYPVTNLLDSRLTRVFRTDSNTTAEVVFDNVTAVTVTSICIANHNISSSVTTLKVQGNATDSWGAPSVDETLTYTSGVITKQFTGGSYRYWRIQVVDATNSDGYIQIGRAWMGTSYTVPGIAPTVAHDLTDNSIVSRSVSGQTYGDIKYFNDTISLNFPIVTYTEKTEIMTEFKKIGSYTPIFATFTEPGLDISTIYVTINQDTISATLTNDATLYELSLTLREET